MGGDRQQDLDHPRRALGPDDPAGAHQSRQQGLARPVHAAGAEDSRQRGQPVPDPRHDRRRDQGARLSRHEGIRTGLRRLQGAGRQPAGRRRGPGLQAAHGNLRIRPHPDGRPCGRRGAERVGGRPAIRQGPRPVRQADLCLPPRGLQGGVGGGRDHDRPPAHLFLGAREGWRPSLRHRGGHGQAAGRARGVVQRRQRAPDPRRQRLCRGVPDQPHHL